MLLTHAHPDHWFGLRHLGRSAVHAGPVTARFPEGYAARVVQERGADSAAPVIGGVELRHRLVTDTEAPAMLLVEVRAAGALIAGDLLYNRVHAVVSRSIDNWVAALDGLGGTPLILGGHGEPAAAGRLPEAVRCLRAAQALSRGRRTSGSGSWPSPPKWSAASRTGARARCWSSVSRAPCRADASRRPPADGPGFGRGAARGVG